MRTFWLILLLIAGCVVVRGFIRTEALAGHDTVAYYISQSEFHENIREGTLWPRWQGDGRYGYGDIKLQHRPPLSHFIAEPFIFLTGKRILGTHISIALLVFLAGMGMFLLTRRWLGFPYAVVASVSFITANFFLSNLYLRGAWYEVAAYAAMPWILWTNENLCVPRSKTFRVRGFEIHRRPFFLCLGAMAWASLICGHPQTGLIFALVAISHILLLVIPGKSYKGLIWASLALLGGLLLSAPYWLVFQLELRYVRMQLYDLGLQSYFRNFLSLPSLLFEAWPHQYHTYTGGVDYLGRPIHVEMRSLNAWVLAAIIIAPILWFLKGGRSRSMYPYSLFYYFWIVATIAIALPLSWGVWEVVRPLQYFNFPWRALGVTSFCLALLTALTLKQVFISFQVKRSIRIACVSMLIAFMIANAWPHTGGWASKGYPNEFELQPERIRLQDGIPQHFHTPRWVTDYPKHPASADVEILEGKGKVENSERSSTVWTLNLTADTPVVIQFNHHYYPGWFLESDTFDTIEAEPSLNGLMIFGIPQGCHSLTLCFGSTPERVVSNILALIALIVLLGILGFSINRNRTNASGGDSC